MTESQSPREEDIVPAPPEGFREEKEVRSLEWKPVWIIAFIESLRRYIRNEEGTEDRKWLTLFFLAWIPVMYALHAPLLNEYPEIFSKLRNKLSKTKLKRLIKRVSIVLFIIALAYNYNFFLDNLDPLMFAVTRKNSVEKTPQEVGVIGEKNQPVYGPQQKPETPAPEKPRKKRLSEIGPRQDVFVPSTSWRNKGTPKDKKEEQKEASAALVHMARLMDTLMISLLKSQEGLRIPYVSANQNQWVLQAYTDSYTFTSELPGSDSVILHLAFYHTNTYGSRGDRTEPEGYWLATRTQTKGGRTSERTSESLQTIRTWTQDCVSTKVTVVHPDLEIYLAWFLSFILKKGKPHLINQDFTINIISTKLIKPDYAHYSAGAKLLGGILNVID